MLFSPSVSPLFISLKGLKLPKKALPRATSRSRS